jgi:glutamate dehydrogenase/leucine dehydrogenase
MVESLSEQLVRSGAQHLVLWRDAASGLEAVLVLDDLTRGPAAGGIRTWRYPSLEHAAADALRLARAMTLKCALAGLDAGGGKAVVLDHPGLDRARAFDVIGERVESLRGLFRTAGDLGTTAADLEVVARRTRYVHLGERDLAAAVARGLLRAVEATVAVLDGREPLVGARLEGRSVLVQGAA